MKRAGFYPALICKWEPLLMQGVLVLPYQIKLLKDFQLHSAVVSAPFFCLIGVDRLG